MLVDWPVWSLSLVWSIWLVWLIGLVWLLTGWTIALSVGMLVSLRLSWLIGDLAADSSIRVFAGCWFGHDRSRSWKIWQLAAVSGSLLAAGLVMMIVNRMVSCGWQKHQDFCWLLDVGRFFWPMEDQEIGGITRKFDGRWLSRDHRGQRKVRSVGEIRNIRCSLNFVSDSDFLERNII